MSQGPCIPGVVIFQLLHNKLGFTFSDQDIKVLFGIRGDNSYPVIP